MRLMDSLKRLSVSFFSYVGLAELFVLAVGLSMDAFAVSVCKGLSLGKINGKHMMLAGVWFGGFQALMPLIGYYLGSMFTDMITSVSHWIAFFLLMLIGGSMIHEARSEAECVDASMDVKSMCLLAVATSIDALAVGVSFAFLQVSIIPAVCLIGAVTFVCSAAGVKIGRLCGMRYRSRAEICGGVILILIAVKTLVQGMGW